MSTLFSETGFSLNLNFGWLVGQQAPGILLPLSPPCWDYSLHTVAAGFYVVDANAVPRAWIANPLPMQPSLQLLDQAPLNGSTGIHLGDMYSDGGTYMLVLKIHTETKGKRSTWVSEDKGRHFLFIFFNVEESSHLAGVDSQIMKTELWSCIYYLRKLPTKMLSIKLKYQAGVTPSQLMTYQESPVSTGRKSHWSFHQENPPRMLFLPFFFLCASLSHIPGFTLALVKSYFYFCGVGRMCVCVACMYMCL